MARTRLVTRMGTGTTVSKLLDDSDGSRGLHQRKLSLDPGAVATGTVAGFGESWYLIKGTALLAPETSQETALQPDTAVWLPRGTSYQVRAEEPAEILINSLHADTTSVSDPAGQVRVVSLADCAVESTGDRKFRVLLSSGLTFTQFVGEIPPGRAPAHHHTYDEVVYVLSGHGLIHLGDSTADIGPGTSVYLSPYTEHCLENTGTETLRVLGMFHPAGSPTMKYTS